MDIRGLGYIGIDVADIDGWHRYAELLGMMVVPEPGGLLLRIDERPFRVVVRADREAEKLAFAGWELADQAALDCAGAELAAAGCSIDVASVEDCATRRVRGLLRTTDPGGFVLELFHGPILDHELFVSPTGVSGFRTGLQGFGHIVLGTPSLAESIAFYTQVLGFRVSDFWRPGHDDVVFLRCNGRHHSLALVAAPEPALYHFMVEAITLDDVGYTLDRHHDTGTPISRGIGKHTNDQMVSFYSHSPSGFEVEFGFGGIQVDDSTWTVTEITKPSFWGHRPPATNEVGSRP
jgi:3,4-dihydroxy-9,10-secoandrosta-1,3,5(10)-triene-9,17-dione 4,5-dioxygenase